MEKQYLDNLLSTKLYGKHVGNITSEWALVLSIQQDYWK